MSLTEFISNKTVRDRITDEFPNQGNRATGSVKAEWQTQNYMLIGTAVDYLLRFWLRRNVSEYHAQSWIAEASLEIAKREFPQEAAEIDESINRAKNARDEYLETGQITRTLIEASIDLARIDGLYRGGEVPQDLGQYDDDDIVDCTRLIEILDDCGALDGSEAYLNPTFGLASGLVGGADADVILDGTLVDVKTTGKATFKAEYWRQLVGYLVLADVHRALNEMGVYDQLGLGDELDDQPVPEIDEFGVYFVRHGELSTVPASVVYEVDNYSEFRSWFVETALEKYKPFQTDDLRNMFQELF